MIGSINGNKGIVVQGSGRPYIAKSFSSNGGMAGDVMYDMDNQVLKVYDGSSWIPMTPNYVTIELSNDIISIIDWARYKRNEEFEREQLAQTNPTIKDLVNQIKEKENQIKMIQTLIRPSDNDTVKMMGN